METALIILTIVYSIVFVAWCITELFLKEN